MNSKKILVTGAGGYIGRYVVSTLLDFGMSVTAVDIRTEGIDERAESLQYDIFNGKESIYTDLGEPDVCLHLAWRDGFVHNSNAHMEYLYDHYVFAKNMVEGGLRQFAALGSMHEVGYHEGAIDENTGCNPKSLYGIAKNALRQSLQLLSEQEKFCFQWLRGYYIMGDDLKNHSIFTKILEAEKEGKEFFPLNLGTNQYDFITIENMAREIALTVIQDEVSGVINCCTGNPVSLKNKVEEFIAERNLAIRPQYGVFPERSYDSPIVYGDTKKISAIIMNAKGNQEVEHAVSVLKEIVAK
ncbi:NAD-dependent epimerase/dehydratase family protein [Sporofaciens sp. SGI.106]|uniref:NAD-dependent epimerase/dehydratase family protein n=1 Tax=Sporofaciens sp. SGI.106 TaxID=3420568 RepID=UPI002A9AFB89|nr:NAD(P)-dependent oxidoreductase [Lachnoclostridium sp.]